MARIVALILAVVVAASGSGLPMCVTLLARAAEPCPMHEHSQGGGTHHAVQVVAGHPIGDPCHSDADLGCATGGNCPTGGTAAQLGAQPPLSSNRLARAEASVIDGALHSFLSPPAPPPPQA